MRMTQQEFFQTRRGVSKRYKTNAPVLVTIPAESALYGNCM
jgi:hypothetical protein